MVRCGHCASASARQHNDDDDSDDGDDDALTITDLMMASGADKTFNCSCGAMRYFCSACMCASWLCSVCAVAPSYPQHNNKQYKNGSSYINVCYVAVSSAWYIPYIMFFSPTVCFSTALNSFML